MVSMLRNKLRNASITNKLNVLTAVSVSAALSLCWLSFLINHAHTMLAAKQRQIQSLAKVIAYNSVAALEFDDRVAATETLASLQEQPTVCCATLFWRDGRPFAFFDRHGDKQGGARHASPQHDTRWLPIPRTIEIDYPIVGHQGIAELSQDLFSDEGSIPWGRDDRQPQRTNDDVGGSHAYHIGRLVIHASTNDIYEQLAVHTLWTIPILAISLCIGLSTARGIQRLITEPVRDLARTAQRIATEDELSMRAVKYGDDEIGQLCDSFNEMIDRLNEGREALRRANQELERRVEERTSELADALDRAMAASRAKSDFLANMSHEIRTPMTAVLGYAELLGEDDQLSPANRERIDVILRNGRHLLTIINDILDVSKIEAGKMTVEILECSVCEIIADVCSLMRPRALQKGLNLEVQYPTAIPKIIRTDPTRLRQILVNLLTNAIKFTKQGAVTLTVAARNSTAENAELELQVEDTGIGLTAEQQHRIFQAFTQADETMTRRFGGTGLGLTISKGLTELLGGTIEVHSEAGKGSKFTVRIPIGSLQGVEMIRSCRELLGTNSPGSVQTVTPNNVSGRILLVEDGVDNQKLLSFLLRRAGADVTIAENGKVGMEKALEAWRMGTPFDLIFMDMQMPVMDGYTATSELRRAGYTLPIVALTAHAMSHDRAACLKAGCDDFVTKPVDRKRLLQTAAEWMAKAREQMEPVGAPLA
ncbi:MAG: response regulator [Planctomycetota bacterium]|nr:MAG: response regulator [Planctomycetota bacterium]